MTKLPLPIDEALGSIVDALAARGVVVLQAPPGAGKTTRVPPAILGAIAENVVVLEPRRLAARLSARRVADELGDRVGGRVGYEVRFERAVSAETRLTYVTEGVLTRRLLDDPSLRGVDAVVLDEFHERHLQGDLALGLLRRLRSTSRPDLRIAVMSATLDAEPVARFLDAEVITTEGKRFDVVVEHALRADDRPPHAQVASAVRRLVQEKLAGDVLVFLPGAAEIRRATEACAAIAAEADLLVLPLHGDLSPAAQDRAIDRADKRKVILSTNVAETSITIDGVVAVIDSGLARIAGHDPWTGRPTLDTGKISRASATQRAGRAGRTAPGRALRLYTKGDHDTRAEHDAPEITRIDFAETLLQLRSVNITDLGDLFLDVPSRAAVDAAESLLRRLGALDAGGAITETGRRMVRLPLPPRLARFLVEAERRRAGEEGCAIAAILGESRDLYARSFDAPRSAARTDDAASDLLVRLEALQQVLDDRGGIDHDRARRLGLDLGAVQSIERAKKQLLRAIDRRPSAPTDVDSAIGLAILSAFPDRVARRRSGEAGRVGSSRDLVLAGGGTAVLDESSAVKTAPYLVAVEARDQRSMVGTDRRARVSIASAIEPDWLIEVFPDAIEETIEVTWRADVERVEAVERLVYDKLVLDERPAGARGAVEASRLLAERAIAAGPRAFLDGDALDRLVARTRFLLRTAKDLAESAGIRAIDEESLRALIVARCEGKRSFGELRAEPLFDELRQTLGHSALARLDELAPEHVTLKNGRRPRVEYAPDQAPSIESRLQDFFGSVETPRIVAGRVPLVLHLLAPNGRDVQVTTDLAGFWSRTYPAVRSELMRKYPRHAWPEDPRTASPPAPRR